MAYSSLRSIEGGRSVRRTTRQTRPTRRRRVRRATRTPTEIGQTVPTTPAGESRKATALKRARRQKRERQERAATRQLRRVLRGEVSSGELAAQRAERRTRKALARGEGYVLKPTSFGEAAGEAVRDVAEGGVVGLIDEDLSAKGRKAIYGTENPSPADVAIMAAPLPVGKLAKGVGRVVTAARGGSKAAQPAAKAVSKAKPKPAIESKLSRAGKRRLEKGKRKVRRIPRSKREAQATWKAKKPAVLTKPGRKVKRRKRAAGLQTVAAVSPAAATTAAGVVGTTGEALIEDVKEGKPLRTIGTTARTLPAMAAGVVGTAQDIGTSGKRAVEKLAGNERSWEDVLDPLEGELEAQKAYWKTVADIAGGDTEAVQEELGLVPVATGALTALAAAKPFAAGGTKAPTPSRHARNVESPKRAKRVKAKGKIMVQRKKGPTVRQGHKGRKRGAERAAVAGERTRAIGAVELKQAEKKLAKAHRRKIGEGISLADTAQVLARTGSNLDDPKQTLTRLKAHRENLREPSKEIDPDDLATRPVLDALIRAVEDDPTILRDKNLRGAIEGLGAIQRGRSEERHRERLGEEAEGPDPADERARLMHLAREEGIPLPEERIPHGLKGATRLAEKEGQVAGKALREEAKLERRSAKGLLEKARREETKARATARELSVRRIADERRVASRTRDAKERRLEKRLATWEAKLRAAKTPATRARYAAKVDQLREQITFTRAARDLAASPVRLRTVKRVTEHRQRAEGMRARADTELARAAAKEAHLGRFKRAEGLEREADRLEAEGARLEADDIREQATGDRREAIEADERLRDDFIEETLQRIEEKGYVQPVYVRETDISDQGRLNVLTDFPGGKVPAKGKMREGTLAAEGRIDESASTLLRNLYSQRRAMELQAMWRNFVDETRLRIGGQTIFTGPAGRKLERQGQVPRGYALMPVQEFERTLAQGKWEEAAGLIDSALRREVREAKREQGKKYAIVPEAELRELRAQMEPPGQVTAKIRILGYVQSAVMLGTSPLWFAFQFPATIFAAAVAHPNPALWLRAAKQIATDWRKVAPRDRMAFRAHFGGTSSDVLMRRQTATSLEPDTVRDMSAAIRLANKTPAGRALHAIGQNLKRGGPLMSANRRYEAWMRTMTGLVEMQKLNRSQPAKRFLRRLAGLNDLTTAHLHKLRDMSDAERITFYARHPREAEPIARGVRDTLGDWAALSSRERGLAAVTVFYPFLRFSLRWVFVSFPRRHPIKAAILLNLAQQNSQELEQLLGGEPDFFTKWGTTVTHTGEEGEAIKGLETHRFNPGSNALVEALGAGRVLNLATLSRPFQPLFGIAASGLQGYDPLTGEATDEDRFTLIARQLLSLSPGTRSLNDDLGLSSDSAVAKLFAKITGREDDLLGTVFRSPVVDLRKERQAAGLGRLLDLTEKPDTGEVIREAIATASDPVAAAKTAGADTAQRIYAAQKAGDELQRILEAEGLGDDPAMEEAIDLFFSAITPAQFGEKPKKVKRAKASRGGGGGGWYGSSSGSGSGGGKGIAGNYGGSASGGRNGGGWYSNKSSGSGGGRGGWY